MAQKPPQLKLQQIVARAHPAAALSARRVHPADSAQPQISARLALPINVGATRTGVPVPPTPRSTLAYIRDNAREGLTQRDQAAEAEQLYRETVDPFLRDRPKQQFSCVAWLALPIVTVLSWLLMLLCLGVDNLDSGWQYEKPSGEAEPFPQWWHYDLKSLVWTLLNPVPAHCARFSFLKHTFSSSTHLIPGYCAFQNQARNLMHAVIPSLMFLFGMLITFIGIVLQFAGKKTTTHVNSILVKDPFILIVLGSVMIFGCFTFWVQGSIGSPILPASTAASSSSSSSLPFASSSSASAASEMLSSSSLSFSSSFVRPPFNSSSSSSSNNGPGTGALLADALAASVSSGASSSELETSSLMAGPSTYPRFALIICVLGVSMTTVLFAPFAMYMSTFLDSDSVIEAIMTKGLNAFVASINEPGRSLEFHRHMQQRTNNALKYLMDTAESAMNEFNSNLCGEAMDAMCSYTMNYINLKKRASPVWFTIPKWIRVSPDFLFLNEESLRDIMSRKTWFEWKTLRQYQNIFVQCLALEKRELCYHVCINTRIIGETAGALDDLHTVDLCLKFFNTYLRQAINVNDVRVVYNCFFQYRQMVERFVDRSRGANKGLALRAWKATKFMLYYAYACQQKRLFFLVETVAQDLRVLCQVAMASAQLKPSSGVVATAAAAGFDPERAVFREIHDKLLKVLLDLADISEGSGSKRGVMRALGILAAFYTHAGQGGQARKIQYILQREPPQILTSLREELLANSVLEFWEVSERGVNFAYLAPHLQRPLRKVIEQVFSMQQQGDAAAAATSTSSDFWKTADGKKLKLDQELTNFQCALHDETESDDDDGDSDVDGL